MSDEEINQHRDQVQELLNKGKILEAGKIMLSDLKKVSEILIKSKADLKEYKTNRLY